MTHGALRVRTDSAARRVASLLLFCFCWAVGGGPAEAGTVFLPTGLEQGATFQIAFVTSGTTRATSADAATYDAFVSALAKAAGLDVVNGQQVTWSAIVSTSTVDARDHAPQSAPVYNLMDRLVTPDVGGLWNTRLDFLDNPINVTETGEELYWGDVWTGTDEEGRALPFYAMGSTFAVGLGDPSSIFPTWTSTGVFRPTASARLYALSSPIRVVILPEPSSMSMAALALGLAAAARRYCRR